MRQATVQLFPPAMRAAAALCAVLAVGCGGGAPSSAPAVPPPPAAVDRTTAPSRTAPAAPVATTAPSSTAPDWPDTSTSVRSLRDVPVYAEPAPGGPLRVLPARDGFGSPLALLVLDRTAGWYEVLLPGRPNGDTGWVRSADVVARELRHEVRIDLSDRTLTLVSDGEVVLSTPAAVGGVDHPTPEGRFSLTDKLLTGRPEGAYGPYALGLSGRSEVLTEFRGGDGQIGIHGTNEPGSIGQAVSHGCIRVPNDVVTTLNDRLPLGTPVVIAP